MDQRQHIRTAVFAPADVTSRGITRHECIKDISPGGAYIESGQDLPDGEIVLLAFSFPSYRETITLPCRVVRSDGSGIGVRFHDIARTVGFECEDEQGRGWQEPAGGPAGEAACRRST